MAPAQTKYTQFSQIPQFTKVGGWECDFCLDDVWTQIEKWQSPEEPSPLDIDPDFQRAHVWTEAQQIAWIEFFLRGGKSGRVLYFNHAGWFRDWKGPFVIVDGKQRLEAIRRFIHNEIRVFGSFYREFTDRLRIIQTVKLNVNDLKTRREVLQWYIEMNAGGTPHTAEEIAKAMSLLEAESR